jgi:hypothetical protein
VADGGLTNNLRRVSEANETSLKGCAKTTFKKGCAKTNVILEIKNTKYKIKNTKYKIKNKK